MDERANDIFLSLVSQHPEKLRSINMSSVVFSSPARRFTNVSLHSKGQFLVYHTDC